MTEVSPVITVGPLGPADRPAWETLFRAYNDFYESVYPQAVYDRAWTEFQAGARMHALGAWANGDLVGITHFFAHVATTSLRDSCYLEDLFTAPAVRGQGVGRALIEAVAAWATERGCGRVYWHTQESNATARRLYDQVASLPGFIMYNRELPG